jgi:hypothetical protein
MATTPSGEFPSVASMEGQTEEAAHGASTGEAAQSVIAATPRVETVALGAVESRLVTTMTSQAEATQMGLSPMQTETAMPVAEVV